jgi:hypothetical protein
MYVSLCGPHSFETSTLVPTVNDLDAAPEPVGPFLARF